MCGEAAKGENTSFTEGSDEEEDKPEREREKMNRQRKCTKGINKAERA